MAVVGRGSRPGITPPTSHYPWDTHRKAGMGVEKHVLSYPGTAGCSLSCYSCQEVVTDQVPPV